MNGPAEMWQPGQTHSGRTGLRRGRGRDRDTAVALIDALGVRLGVTWLAKRSAFAEAPYAGLGALALVTQRTELEQTRHSGRRSFRVTADTLAERRRGFQELKAGKGGR